MSKKQMIINYVPGEECRVAIVEDGRLEEFHAERMDGPSNHVGNIYVGKVMNVEQSIQAAFIDFGLEANGFLHTSDVHPQYFPGEEGGSGKTERVGRKTPRRERPPIQDCFRRGDEVAVQVLKEGVGTKGPTVTSYLSIPGRFLVMMPQMDKVGVSRKVEDEDTRRKMREILDQLDLPDGFGFILRTAGMERSKAELKRDLAYLMRLWKDMEKRWKTGNKPRLLYSESDLLVRALRDLLTADIDEVVVDNEAALQRAARFLKIVAPRTATRVVHYTGKSPIFHVMGIEPQIQMIHAREVPLPSGGRLVIDEAEALVAIDVNSGRSREARDSETNAYETNLEAVDEICRQLRLRDLGGVIVNDLIDMRHAKHRREIEARFQANLKKDRARWTTAPISEFGILEMTRQRMRASHESQHFADCPTCRGRGLVQKPDSVAADALRDLSALLDNDTVRRVELVVHPRIAGDLLSTRRRALNRIERTSGPPMKHVDVRVSEAIPVDRVTFYAYDERGADLDLTKLGHRKAKPEELVSYEITSDAGDEPWTVDAEEPTPEPEMYPDERAADTDAHPIELEPLSLSEIAAQDRNRQQQRQHGHQQQQHAQQGEFAEGEGQGGRRRRRRRGGRGRNRGGQGEFQQGAPQQGEYAGEPQFQPGNEPQFDESGAPMGDSQGHSFNAEDQEAINADPSHATGQGSHHHEQPNMNGSPYPNQGDGFNNGEQGQGGRRRRRRRGRRGRGGHGQDQGNFGAPQQGGEGSEQGGYAPAPEGEYSEAPGEGNFGGEQGGFGQGQGESGEGAGFDQGAPAEGYDQGGQGQGEYQQQGQFGPDGQQGEQGEGGRRRRRRRGGRGRNRGQGGEGGQHGGQGGSPAPHGQGHRKQQDQPTSLADMFRSPSPQDQGEGSGGFDQQGEGNYAPESPTDSNESGGDGEGDSGQAPEGGSDQPGDGEPRRRRRRGGRGRGRNRGGEGGGGGGDRGGEGGPRGESGGSREPRESSAPPPHSPAPAPQQPPAGAPKIRTLYSSRKRVSPAALKAPKRED
jgi:ribonuclease E